MYRRSAREEAIVVRIRRALNAGRQLIEAREAALCARERIDRG